jgi:DNA-directed RNA polymerase subunit RPC12/RpoP
MEKGGLIMQVFKCPECGATVDFPKSGNETKCSHCGKSIYAQDVFEKVKGLI